LADNTTNVNVESEA